MKDFLTLKILDRFQFIFKKFNVDYPTLRRILQIKFIMDTRRIPVSVGKARKQPDRDYFRVSLFIYAFMGFFTMVPIAIVINDPMVLMTYIFGILMFLLLMTVIADFSNVLLDVRDKGIILTKPVNPKVLSVAKFIHIFRYLFLITLSLVGPLTLALLVKYSFLEGFVYALLFTMLFIFEVILLNLFIIVLTTLLYLFILKYFSGEKLKDIINYIQITMTIIIAISYQIIGRAFELTELLDFNITIRWYHYFLMPFWFGAPYKLLFEGNLEASIITLTILTIIIPIVAFIIYTKSIGTFENSLLKLNQTDKQKPYKKERWFIAKLITKTQDEFTFYRFSYQMLKSEREFKLRVYPSLGLSMIFPFIFMFQSGFDLAKISTSNAHLYLYFCAFMMPMVTYMLRFSRSYKATWVFYSTPTKNLSDFKKAALKAFLVRLLIPIYVLESIIFTILFGVRIIPDLVAIFLTIQIFTVICYRIFGNFVPFSQPFENATKGQPLVFFLISAILGIMAGIHYAVTLFPLFIYPYVLLLIVVTFIAWKKGLDERNKLDENRRLN